MNGRTDIHSPARFNPADYRVVDYLDAKAPDYGMIFLVATHNGKSPAEAQAIADKVRAAYEAEIFQYFPNWRTGGTDHTSIHQCNHCGASIRWITVVEHIPTGAYLAMGSDCEQRLELPDQDAFRAKYIKDKAARDAAILAKQLERATFRSDYPDVVEFLEGIAGYDDFEFVNEMRDRLVSRGVLSEKQADAMRRIIAKRQEFQARRAAQRAAEVENAGPFPNGRATVVGEVVSVKVQDGYYGLSIKMLVRGDDGNKFYGTLPEALVRSVTGKAWVPHLHGRVAAAGWTDTTDYDLVKNQRVQFSATFEVSSDDEHFGFFKRPTKAEVVK